ncbi:MAG TPA: M23 family metallopeptidase [Solirubrobacteraceae bacterium]|nr:M23 family metallopeptidase [Solirubrobacteraceae bacterium]
MKLAALVLIACLSLASSALAVSWRRPVAGPVLRPFAVSADRYARGQHRGIDLGAPPGAAVYAACSGRVRFAGAVPGGGRTVSVGCGRLVATYQQLGVLAVGRGQAVPAGARIGAVGRSGDPREPRPHVHLGARDAASGRYVDPLTLFGAGPPRALPPLRVAPRALPPLRVAPRRPPPLGPAPRGPVPRRVVARPISPPVAAAPARAPRGTPTPAPGLVAWIGLGAFGLGLPLGGLVVRRQRRQRAVTRRGWAAAHR